jgi:hypothetical protein
MKKELFILIFLGCIFWAKAQNTTIEKPLKPKKLDWSGTIGANTTFYGSNRPFNSGNPFSYNLNANINARLFDAVDIPLSFTMGKYQNTFKNPFVQCSISPHYKWATLYLGNVNLTFNPYTLSGLSFLGVGTELTPGKLRLSAMYGNLAPAVEIDTSGLSSGIASFKRIGYGAKIGYGTNNNFIDLIYFHAKDDENSIKTWKDVEIQKKMGDANLLAPQENDVIGLSSKIILAKNLTFNFDGGVTFFNKNIADTQHIKQKGIDIVTENTLHYAGKASLGYNFKTFYVTTNYERVAPNYVSLGSYFFNNDIENFTISPSGTISNSKGSYNVSAGIQRNNLDKTKTETTKRFIGSANVSYNPTEKWSLMLNYNNFSVRQTPTAYTLPDAILLKQVNQTFTFTPVYTFKADSSATHNFSFTTNYNDVNDRNILTKQFGNMKSTMISLNHSSSFTKSNNSINSGFNFNQIKTFGANNIQLGITTGYSQSFMKQRLLANANINYNISYVNQAQDGSVINGTAFLSYQLKNRHAFTLNSTIVSTSSKQFDGYTEVMGSIGYQFRLK